MSLPVDPWHNPQAPHLPPAAEATPPPYPQPSPPAVAYPAPLTAAYHAGQPLHASQPLHAGQPLSDKSKVVAGLLQLIPSVLFGLAGIGRIYAGHTSVGVAQLAATALGWVAFWCGFVLLFPFALYAAVWLWGVIDGIVLLAGQPVDGNGRPLRT